MDHGSVYLSANIFSIFLEFWILGLSPVLTISCHLGIWISNIKTISCRLGILDFGYKVPFRIYNIIFNLERLKYGDLQHISEITKPRHMSDARANTCRRGQCLDRVANLVGKPSWMPLIVAIWLNTMLGFDQTWRCK